MGDVSIRGVNEIAETARKNKTYLLQGKQRQQVNQKKGTDDRKDTTVATRATAIVFSNLLEEEDKRKNKEEDQDGSRYRNDNNRNRDRGRDTDEDEYLYERDVALGVLRAEKDNALTLSHLVIENERGEGKEKEKEKGKGKGEVAIASESSSLPSQDYFPFKVNDNRINYNKYHHNNNEKCLHVQETAFNGLAPKTLFLDDLSTIKNKNQNNQLDLN